MKELDLNGFEKIDIKKINISEEDLELAKATVDSYLELFNKRARKIKELGLDLNSLEDSKIKELILGEYSFLKRPLMISGEKILAGNSKAVVEEMKLLHGNS